MTMIDLAAKLQVLREYVETHQRGASVSSLHDMVARIDELREETVSLDVYERVKAELRQAKDDIAQTQCLLREGSGLVMEASINDSVLQLALLEIQKMSHTDRCDVPHYKEEVQCTCHIHIVENALAWMEKKP